jgi:hypothetical protein
MAKIEVAKIPIKRATKRDLYAMVCYFYPQYQLPEASKLPARDLYLLIKTAQKMEAIKMFNFTQIAAAPHSKKGSGVKKLADHFKRMSSE